VAVRRRCTGCTPGQAASSAGTWPTDASNAPDPRTGRGAPGRLSGSAAIGDATGDVSCDDRLVEGQDEHAVVARRV
jgi:hypothetical protein